MAIILALAAFVLAVLLHGLAMRAHMRLDSVRRFLMVGVPLGIGLTAYSLARFGLILPGFAAILLYALLCELYMFCFTLVISSVSATMLIMLRQGPIDASALSATYDPHEMVQLRIERLVRNGFIERGNERLTMTKKGMKLHGTFTALGRFFAHEPR